MALPPTDILAARQARIRASMQSHGLDALIVTAPANIRYASNHTGSAGVLLLTADAAHLLIDFRYQEAVAALQSSASACPGLRVWHVPASYDEALAAAVQELGIGRAGFEAAHLTVSRHDWLRRTFAARGAAPVLVPTERVIEQHRIVKDASEIATLRDAAARLTPVAARAVAAVRPGVTERRIAAVIEAALREAGYERLAFDTIVASGPNAALPHYRAGDRVLADGDLVVLDFGGVLDGYCCDLTRTVAVGAPSPETARLFNAVLEAQQAAIAAVRPGIDAGAVDAAARNVLAQWGLAEAFGHGTGHGLGLDIHEEPRVGRARADAVPVRLEAGMVFTVEPGAYLAGWGGVRIEDDVLVTDDGHEVLTAVPYELATR